MGIGDFVSVLVLLSGAATPTVEAFGTPMLAAVLSPAAVTENPERFRVYSSGSALASLVADGVLTTDPIYRDFEAALAQPNVPPQIALGRRALPMTQVLHLTFTDTGTVNTYASTFVGSDGVSHTYSLQSTGVPATDAATYAALMTAANIGTVTISGAIITTTQTTGKLTDVQAWSSNITIADATPDPGITTDLAAILAANSLSWYGVSLDSNGKAEVEAAQAWVEATGFGGKFAFYNSADTANCTAGSGDLNGALQSESYQRCYLQQSNKAVLSSAGFALASQLLANFPGSYNPAYKAIPGVVVDDDQSLTETQRLVLNTMSTSSPGVGGKHGNFYVATSGQNMTWPGCAPGGHFIDLTIFLDWFQANLQADLLALQVGSLKTPFTQFGLETEGAKILSRIKIGGNAPYNGIDLAQPFGVTIPDIDSISGTDKAERNASGFSCNFVYAGAVDTTDVVVQVQQ